jgi:dTDP-glucose 4,6-dehydratase
MNWRDSRVLITGAGGFIGSHLAARLVELGARVRGFIRYTSRRDIGNLRFLPPGILGQLELVAGDLRDPDAVRRAAEGQEVVFHLGALISIPYSYQHPREVVETNVMGTVNVLEAARSANVRRLVHTSTSEVYGTAQRVPIDESHPLQGQSPYSGSKIGADRIAESYWRAFGTPVATIRPFNAYGPGQSARAVIPTIITQALAGGEIRLGSLHPTRDLTFVSDTVAAFIAVAEADTAVGQEINVGSGAEIAIGDLVQVIGSLLGRTLPVVSEEARVRPALSEVERLWADTRKARELLGWSPRVDLKSGLAETIAWIKEHLDWYRPGVYQV